MVNDLVWPAKSWLVPHPVERTSRLWATGLMRLDGTIALRRLKRALILVLLEIRDEDISGGIHGRSGTYLASLALAARVNDGGRDIYIPAGNAYHHVPIDVSKLVPMIS